MKVMAVIRPGEWFNLQISDNCWSFAAMAVRRCVTLQQHIPVWHLLKSYALNHKHVIVGDSLCTHAEGSSSDWPGPKVWPGTQALISFFCLNIYFQAFLKS